MAAQVGGDGVQRTPRTDQSPASRTTAEKPGHDELAQVRETVKSCGCVQTSVRLEEYGAGSQSSRVTS